MHSILSHLLANGCKICPECCTLWDTAIRADCPTCDHWRVKEKDPNVTPNKHSLGARKKRDEDEV